ncbi:MAG: dTDP-4-dehydrorhamnose 3,5-epimerase, partial [Kiritimatiellaceae bacterium]|nr:dTDP-4-dehydrorhamnose 3,5-epimerase [Kiritimatiellaceae bacterium]
MEFIETAIAGLFVIQPRVFEDNRGVFVKNFHEREFALRGLETGFRELFHSYSKKGVIRGMHFQHPPYDHAKMVYVTAGSVLDVIVDLRRGSPTYGQAVSSELSDENHRAIYMPRGCAHGFLSLTDGSCVNYLQTTMHEPLADSGIRYDSFGFNWGCEHPVLSARDLAFSPLTG